MSNPLTKTTITTLTAAGLLAVGGCESLPGSSEQQGAAGGGVGGALAGAAVADENRAIGALIGGLLGAGGGYLVGGQLDKNEDEAREAAENARENPATVEEVRGSDTADLDDNGFVTMDELIVLREADLRANEIIDRAEATDQVFRFNDDQRDELLDVGYARDTLDRLERVNRDVVERYERDNPERISSPS
jgi:hypothetical protein